MTLEGWPLDLGRAKHRSCGDLGRSSVLPNNLWNLDFSEDTKEMEDVQEQVGVEMAEVTAVVTSMGVANPVVSAQAQDMVLEDSDSCEPHVSRGLCATTGHAVDEATDFAGFMANSWFASCASQVLTSTGRADDLSFFEAAQLAEVGMSANKCVAERRCEVSVRFPWYLAPDVRCYLEVGDFVHFRATCSEQSQTKTFVEHMAFVIKPDRLGTFLACESLRASAPPESAHLNVDRLCQNMAGVRFYKMQPFHKDSLQLDGQLRAGCDGFRCLFQHTAPPHWWNASPEAVMGVVTWLASHAQCCGELWQLTFDAILLCLRHVPDWNTRAQLAEQVLTWLHTDALSDSESLYACRCIMYCEPFLHLYDLHDRVLQRIARKNKQATDQTGALMSPLSRRLCG